MKRDIFRVRHWLLIILMVMLTTPLFAQTDTGTDYDSMFATFAALVAVIPFIAEPLKNLIKPKKEVWAWLLTWSVGVVITMLAWVLNVGFLNGEVWWVALLYAIAAAFCANGVFDTGLVEWIIGLFKKKSISNK